MSWTTVATGSNATLIDRHRLVVEFIENTSVCCKAIRKPIQSFSHSIIALQYLNTQRLLQYISVTRLFPDGHAITVYESCSTAEWTGQIIWLGLGLKKSFTASNRKTTDDDITHPLRSRGTRAKSKNHFDGRVSLLVDRSQMQWNVHHAALYAVLTSKGKEHHE